MRAINTLMDLNKFGIKLGLENMELLSAYFNHPHLSYQSIHIAGTNGKGSTTVMTSQLLMLAGNKVATYTSPYVHKVNENFQVNNQEISDADLIILINKVLSAVKKLNITATHYEVCTMIMFLYAQEQEVDYLIIEVGLGGRFDATNIIDPILSVITNVSLDHTEILGDTLEQIAYEKCGIIKTSPVIIGENIEQLVDAAQEISNHVILSFTSIEDIQLDYQNFKTIVSIDQHEYSHNLFGYHQAYNLAIVYQIAKYLEIDLAYFKKMTQEITWPGRFEKISTKPLVICDGAHNEAAMLSLVKSLEYYQAHEIQLIFSMLKEKDLQLLVPIIEKFTDNIIITDLSDYEPMRAMDSEQIYEAINVKNKRLIKNPSEAFAQISEQYSINIICGSFKIIEAFKEWSKNANKIN